MTALEAVRLATDADGDVCAALCSAAVAALNDVRGGSLFARRETGLVAKALLRPGGLRRLLADRKRRLVLGTIDGVPVGLAAGHVDDMGEVPLGVLDGLFVEAEARHVGVGRALLDAMVSWFDAVGCAAVDATVLPGDRHTKNLFEAAGFKARLITMHRPRRGTDRAEER